MAATAAVRVEEYLSRTYRPDCEYVDGVALERNVGERPHSSMQKRLIRMLGPFEDTLGIDALPEQRVQVSPSRFRVPDICVLAPGHPAEAILTKPPFICFEVLSKDDRLSEMRDRVQDYLDFGVSYVWILDPAKSKAFRCLPNAILDEQGTAIQTESPAIA